MSAPAINVTAPPPAPGGPAGATTGVAQPGGKTGGKTGGPTGFEAMLSGTQGQADAGQGATAGGTAATVGATETAAAGVLADILKTMGGSPKAGATDAKTDPAQTAPEKTDPTDAQAGLLAALGFVAPPVVAQAPVTTPAAGGAIQGDAAASKPLVADPLASLAQAAAGEPKSGLADPKGQAATPTTGATTDKLAAAPTPPQALAAPPAPQAATTAPAGQVASQAASQAATPVELAMAQPAPLKPPQDTTSKDRPRKVGGMTPSGDVATTTASPDTHGATPAKSASASAPADSAAATPTDANLVADLAAKRDAALSGPDSVQSGADGHTTDTTATATTTAQVQPTALRGAPQTVANLAADIVKKLGERSTRFDVQLDPAGLGRVDVRVEIGAHGRMTASMSFDNPQAAAELRSRSGELHKALEQSGFDVSGGLSFDVTGDGGRSGQGQQQASQDQGGQTGAAFRGRAFQAALDTAGAADAPTGSLDLRRSPASGVDIRI